MPWTGPDRLPVPEALEHWDPYTDVEFHRIVELDLDLVRNACQLPPTSSFALLASWYSNRTRVGGTGTLLELGDTPGRVRAALSVTVPGTSAGGRLDLRTRFVLRFAGTDPSPLSPKREGASLWADDQSVHLEGAAARFPIAAVSFDSVPHLPSSASWSLEWNPEDLEGPVLGAIRLLLNAGDELLLKAVRTGSSDPRATVIRSFVMFDVTRSLVHGALRSDRFVADPDGFEDGSVGRMLSDLLTACWPGVPVKALAERLIHEPSRLDAELQGQLGALS